MPYREEIPRLRAEALRALLGDLGNDWQMIQDHHLEKTFTVGNFRSALTFTNAVGEIADQQGHHPEVTLTRGGVTLRIWTHKIDGLTESDFILAAKAEQAFRQIPSHSAAHDRKSSEPPRAAQQREWKRV